MKTIIALLLAGAVAASGQSAPAKPADPLRAAEAYYAKGLAAEKANNYAAAKAAYTEALRLNPNHANSRFRLKEVELNKDGMDRGSHKARFGKLVLPEVRFDGATLQEALDALGSMISKQSNQKMAANFIVQDSKNLLGSAKITLTLQNLPASAVIDYVVGQANAKATYDGTAIIISPK